MIAKPLLIQLSFLTFTLLFLTNSSLAKVLEHDNQCMPDSKFQLSDDATIHHSISPYTDCHFQDGLVPVIHDDKVGYANPAGKVVINFDYDNGHEFTEGLAEVSKDRKHGFINTKGEVIVPLIYDNVGPFSDGMAHVIREYTTEKDDGFYLDERHGFVNAQGKEVIPTIYKDADYFGEGLAGVQKDDKWGFINKQGDVVIDFQYDYVNRFSDGLARVMVGDKNGFINHQNKMVIKPQYCCTGFFEDGMVTAKKGGKWGLIDKNNNILIPFEYSQLTQMDEKNHLWAGKEGKSYVININQQQLSKQKYDSYYEFNNLFYGVKINGKYGLIDKQLQTVLPIEYNYLDSQHRGLAVIGKNGKYGFINELGQIVIPLEYDFVNPFYQEIISVEKNGKYGFINTKEEIIIPFEYDYDHKFMTLNGKDVVQVKKDSKDGVGGKDLLFDIQGNMLIDEYDSMFWIDYWGAFSNSFDINNPSTPNTVNHWLDRLNSNTETTENMDNRNVAIVSKDGKEGIINEKAEVIIPLDYDDIEIANLNYAIITQNNKQGLINSKNNLIIPPEYETISVSTDNLIVVSKEHDNNDYDEAFGFVNYNNEIVIPLEYAFVYPFTEGLAGVIKNDDFLYGYIDKNNQVILDFQYLSAFPFENGKAIVTLKNEEGHIINKKGEIIDDFH